MKKTIAATAVFLAATVGLSGTAFGGGPPAGPEDVQVHPGHWGYVQTDGGGGGIPATHFHEVAPYETGPGGWGATVSSTVKGGGNPHR